MAETVEEQRKRVRREKEQKLAALRKLAAERGISEGESFARGLGQGTTFGFGDEMSGVVSAGLRGARAMLGGDNTYDKGRNVWFGDDSIYSDIRDRRRAENEAAREANPGSYFMGEMTGAVATPGGSTKAIGTVGRGASRGANVLKGALMGGASGAASGLGYSDSEFGSDDENTDVARGTLIGAVTGGVGGALTRATRPRNLRKALENEQMPYDRMQRAIAENPKLRPSDLSPSLRKLEGEFITPETVNRLEQRAIRHAETVPRTKSGAVNKIYEKGRASLASNRFRPESERGMPIFERGRSEAMMDEATEQLRNSLLKRTGSDLGAAEQAARGVAAQAAGIDLLGQSETYQGVRRMLTARNRQDLIRAFESPDFITRRAALKELQTFAPAAANALAGILETMESGNAP